MDFKILDNLSSILVISALSSIIYPDFKIAKSLIFVERFLSLAALAKYSNAKTWFPSLIAIFDKLNKERPEYPLDSPTKDSKISIALLLFSSLKNASAFSYWSDEFSEFLYPKYLENS